MKSMMQRIMFLVFCGLVAGLAGFGAQAQEKQQATQQGDYQLGAGDAIRILVFQNPDLTLDSRVSEGGTITYPLIGTVQIGGLTISGAEKKIATALKAGGDVYKRQDHRKHQEGGRQFALDVDRHAPQHRHQHHRIDKGLGDVDEVVASDLQGGRAPDAYLR